MKLIYIVFEMCNFFNPSAVSFGHVLMSCDMTQVLMWWFDRASQLTDRNIVVFKYYFVSLSKFRAMNNIFHKDNISLNGNT